MMYRLISTALITGALGSVAPLASAQVWDDIDANAIDTKTGAQNSNKSHAMAWARKVRTDKTALNFILNKAPHERLGASDVTIDLPLPDGGVGTFTLLKSPIIAPGLSQKYPNMQTYRVIDTQDSGNTGRLDMTSNGFSGMLQYKGELIYIDPVKGEDAFHSFYESDYEALRQKTGEPNFSCGFEDHAEGSQFTPTPQKTNAAQNTQKITLGDSLKVYRIAVVATGEYTQDFGGTVESGLAAVVTNINRLNVFFEADAAIRFEVVANNDQLIFTDPDTDPFPDQADKASVLGEANQVMIDGIGVDAFDIGHVFGTFGGGVAVANSVCTPGFKGAGVTGTVNAGEVGFVNILAHEMGHQFNAPHSFNGSTGACEFQRSTVSNAEPHSGATFMSYHGICGAENLLGLRGRFFHNVSQTFITNAVLDPASGAMCGSTLATSNRGPVIDAGVDGTIPMSTPFTLTGTASDADGDSLLHIWEQVDLGTPNASADDFADEGTRALFRSFVPNPSLSRTFPQLERVLAGDRVIGEVLPSTDRDMTFRMTTRDGSGGIADDERIISVTTAAGPFTIETPSAALEAGVPHTVTWDVANTSAAPVSCDMVRLELSTDGGNSFPHMLNAATANTGTASVTFPNVTTTTGRLRASCNNQPFFAINDANFTMTPMIIVNMAPEAVNDTASVVEDSRRAEILVLANDSDPDGDTFTLVSVTPPNQGGAVEIAGSSVLYTPLVGFVGTETFNYTIDDGNNNTASALVTVTVTEKPNTAPDIQDITFTTQEDSAAMLIDVLAGAVDADGDSLTVQSLGTLSNGGTARIENNQVSYTPAVGFSGTETFTYSVTDNEGAVVSANVTVTVTPRPNVLPVVENAALTVDQDSSAALVDVLAGASDADGDTLTLVSVGTPSNGGSAAIQNGQLSYTPARGFSGSETVSFTISDGEGGEATATLNVTVRVDTVQVVSSQVSSNVNSSGGGVFGPFMLLLLGLRAALTRRREKA
jgi:hypothetical protein